MNDPGSDQPPTQFSLLTLIIAVNVIGLGVAPVLNSGTDWHRLIGLSMTFTFVLCFMLVNRTGFVELKTAYRAGLWSALSVYLLFALYLYNAPPQDLS